jgi:hypothetical protein
MVVQWDSTSAVYRIQESLCLWKKVLYNILIEFSICVKLVGPIKMCLNETCSKVHVDKHLYDAFPFQNEWGKGGALSPSHFNFALDYAIMKAQENHMGLEENEIFVLLVYAYGVNLLGKHVNTTTKRKK